MCAPCGLRVLRGNLRSGTEHLTITSVSKLSKRICQVRRLVPAAFERPQHPSILQEMISTVPPLQQMASIGSMGWYTTKGTLRCVPGGFDDSFRNVVQDFDRSVASSGSQVEGAS